MALSISPADGFISRLLQQSQNAPTSKAPASSNPQTSNKQDQSSISQEARQAGQTSHSANNQRLESKLIDLYNQKGNKAG